MIQSPNDLAPSAEKTSSFARWGRRASLHISLAVLALVLVMVFALPFTMRFVGPGEIGVLWQRFEGGTVVDHTYPEGFHIIMPWDKFFVYSLRLQEHEQHFNTISSDGLNMEVNIAVRYRIDPRRVALLHKHVGPNYLAVLVDPAVGSYARELISLYTPEELYKSARSFIQNQITERLNRDNLLEIEEAGGAVNLLIIEDVLVKGITMPDSVRQAIERKAEQNQVMLEYEYRLQREEREKMRRKIEAEGLKTYEDVMPKGISKSYLLMRGIEASLELAKSPNTKIVMFGNDSSNNLPFILNSLLNESEDKSGAAATKKTSAAEVPAAPVKSAQNQVDKLLKRLNPVPRTKGPEAETGAQPAEPETSSSAPANANHAADAQGQSANLAAASKQ